MTFDAGSLLASPHGQINNENGGILNFHGDFSTDQFVVGRTTGGGVPAATNNGLNLKFGSILNNFATFTNAVGWEQEIAGGTFNNELDPTLTNDGVLSNNGTLNNIGTLNNNFNAVLINEEALSNSGTLTNDGTLDNGNTTGDHDGTLTNTGTLTNNGTLNNIQGTLTNKMTLVNDGTLINKAEVINNINGVVNQRRFLVERCPLNHDHQRDH